LVGGSSIHKGWVRDGILSSLAKGPRNSSDMAKELGVSKATVSYHTKSLVRRGMIEISDVKSVRGGVYSKTFALKPGNLVLVHRVKEQGDSLSKLDEVFERLLMSWHLNPERAPADEIKIFLYHAFRLLAESDSLEDSIFEEFGARVGQELVSGSLKFDTLRGGLKEFVAFLGERKMADMRVESGKNEARIVCSSCFENSEHGSKVCQFTTGVVEGTLRAKRGAKYTVVRKESTDIPACVFTIRWGRPTQ
jgi:predicted hydrocarbon binding protein